MDLRPRILVVEHDPRLSQLCEELLEEEGFEVHLATHGKMALSVMDTVRPDIVVLEMMMPFLDGFSFLKAIRQRAAWQPPVVAMSAIPAYVELAREAGARIVLRKPFETRTLVSALRDLTDGVPLTSAPSPWVEQEEHSRLRAVLELQLPEQEAGVTLQSFVRRVARIFDCPMGMVSIVSETEQRFYAHCGIPEDLSRLGGAPRGHSFCTHSVAGRSALVVQDTLDNPFFASNLLVRERGIRFYAGVPIFSELGAALGTLCLLDYVPHAFTYFDLELLSVLAKRVAAELQRRQQTVLDGKATPAKPPAHVEEEVHVFGREAFAEALVLQSGRCAERRLPLMLCVLAPGAPPAHAVSSLEAAFPMALLGRLGAQRLGMLIAGTTAAQARPQLLEAAGDGTTLVAADLSGVVLLPDLVLHRTERALGTDHPLELEFRAPFGGA